MSAPAAFAAIGAIVALVCFRLLPFVAYVLGSRSVPLVVRLIVLGAFIALAGLTVHFDTDAGTALTLLPAAYAYFALVALALPLLAKAMDAGWLGKVALFVLLAVPYVGVPATLAPATVVVPVLLLGWDSWLKAYSYCRERAERQRGFATSELLFFMLVSPVPVLPERGSRIGVPELRSAGASRFALGIATFVLEDVLRFVAVRLGSGGLLTLAALALLAFAYFLSHSGLASVQIGLMRLIGYSVCERYEYPFLARDPLGGIL